MSVPTRPTVHFLRGTSADGDAQLRRIAIGIPAVVICVSAAMSIVDLRLALAGAAFVIGWTQLVGL